MGKQVAARLKWGCSSVGRAPALQAGGQGFESLHLHEDNYFKQLSLRDSGRRVELARKRLAECRRERIFEKYP